MLSTVSSLYRVGGFLITRGQRLLPLELTKLSGLRKGEK